MRSLDERLQIIAGVERVMHAPPVQVIAVTGGKGGVGKTSIAVNLATALSARERRVVLFDGDLGLANVDVFLGLTPRFTLAQVLDGECTLDEALLDTAQGFRVVPAASGVARLATLDRAQHVGLINAFSQLVERIDTLVIDTAPGIVGSVLQFAQAAQHVLVVICDDPASLTDAYALVKVLSRDYGVLQFRVLANQVEDRGSGRRLFDKLQRVAGRFLDVTLDYAGEIPADPALKRAIREQRPVVDAFPRSPAARALKELAAHADSWPVAASPRGNVEFFIERLVRRPPARLEVVE
jgi:flagellar biosynthesis protein FlhG